MDRVITDKLAQLPQDPGVYFFKDNSGKIIYVGKAAVLRNRVRQYFQASRSRDPKTEALVKEITDLEWMSVESELDALFLEAEMIRRYMPRYNILLRDDKSMSYVRINYDSSYPTVSITRYPLDDGARYFGPYLSSRALRQALKILRRVFPFATNKTGGQKRASLHYHLGLDPGLEEGKTSLEDYRANLRKLIAVIEGKRKSIEKELEKDMKRAAKNHDYEAAARYRNQLFSLRSLDKQVVFSDKEFLDISKDQALGELVQLLGLNNYPKRIEGYDVSHMSGTDVVASMVVFTNGVSNKREYRKFKSKYDINNDFYNMHETITRRLSAKNIQKWGLAVDLMLIDGGKGQLDAALKARNEAGQEQIPMIGLAKREEQIVIDNDGSKVELNTNVLRQLGGSSISGKRFTVVNLPNNSNAVKLLQRLRDESHRFAVSYHSVLKTKRQTASILDDIPTIGPATRRKLLKTFGSVRGIVQARQWELEKTVGTKKATILRQYLRADR